MDKKKKRAKDRSEREKKTVDNRHGGLKPFMRLVLDEMPEDPDPILPTAQGTFVGYDDAGDLKMAWDSGRKLYMIPDVDKWHVVGTTSSDEQNEEELAISFLQLRKIQDELKAGDISRCPRCGSQFDVKRGAISRRVDQISICPLCGQQEAVEDFLKYTGKDESPKEINDWYIVKIWQGRLVSTSQ